MKKIILSSVTILLLFSCEKRLDKPGDPDTSSSAFRTTGTNIHLTSFSTGYTAPIDVTNAGDNRMFVAEQGGKIFVCDAAGVKRNTPYLDISDKIMSSSFTGLLSFCFSPNYKTNGYFYVYYVDNSYDVIIERYKVSATDSNKANKSSALTILRIDYPVNTEITGCVRYGKDGYLYIGTADGSSGDGTDSKAQNHSSLLGKMLRIDVNNSSASNPYDIPADNPFVGFAGYSPEIYALGFRVPWRFSFDAVTGSLCLGDVGQATEEELDIIKKGKNYGWPCYEGTYPYSTTNCTDNYVFPSYEYSHATGCCVIGGYVYRGSATKGYGKYIFCDWCTGQFTSLFMQNGNIVSTPVMQENATSYVSFGEDYYHELYTVNQAGNTIYKLIFAN